MDFRATFLALTDLSLNQNDIDLLRGTLSKFAECTPKLDQVTFGAISHHFERRGIFGDSRFRSEVAAIESALLAKTAPIGTENIGYLLWAFKESSRVQEKLMLKLTNLLSADTSHVFDQLAHVFSVLAVMQKSGEAPSELLSKLHGRLMDVKSKGSVFSLSIYVKALLQLSDLKLHKNPFGISAEALFSHIVRRAEDFIAAEWRSDEDGRGVGNLALSLSKLGYKGNSFWSSLEQKLTSGFEISLLDTPDFLSLVRSTEGIPTEQQERLWRAFVNGRRGMLQEDLASVHSHKAWDNEPVLMSFTRFSQTQG
eukprot:TRINITY_DN4178_c0_g3_i3.p1 TRINITY_DN4178_c0_g3~~TRINITY_DN4178_c0_g3_i3.p1  ORF type:complete len:311 (+),score=71.17 TRINITY_DN4178_c0_g3_i3:327-1259(+)